MMLFKYSFCRNCVVLLSVSSPFKISMAFGYADSYPRWWRAVLGCELPSGLGGKTVLPPYHPALHLAWSPAYCPLNQRLDRGISTRLSPWRTFHRLATSHSSVADEDESAYPVLAHISAPSDWAWNAPLQFLVPASSFPNLGRTAHSDSTNAHSAGWCPLESAAIWTEVGWTWEADHQRQGLPTRFCCEASPYPDFPARMC